MKLYRRVILGCSIIISQLQKILILTKNSLMKMVSIFLSIFVESFLGFCLKILKKKDQSNSRPPKPKLSFHNCNPTGFQSTLFYSSKSLLMMKDLRPNSHFSLISSLVSCTHSHNPNNSSPIPSISNSDVIVLVGFSDSSFSDSLIPTLLALVLNSIS